MWFWRPPRPTSAGWMVRLENQESQRFSSSPQSVCCRESDCSPLEKPHLLGGDASVLLFYLGLHLMELLGETRSNYGRQYSLLKSTYLILISFKTVTEISRTVSDKVSGQSMDQPSWYIKLTITVGKNNIVIHRQ